MKRIFSCLFLFVIFGFFCSGPGDAADELQVTVAGRQAQLNYQLINDEKLLVSVLDAEENPIRGLQIEDFRVQKGTKPAKILAVEPLETSEEVALNIVLVVDNSFSMKERQAIKPLLSALQEFLKMLRPIDNVHAVVFDQSDTLKVKEYPLHARTFHSREIGELQRFFENAFEAGLSSKTYLYEAMVAGIDIVRAMPEKDHKFLVVFSDGEDLNSDFKSSVVESEAFGIANLEAYCVDYMPGPKKDRFLQSFAQTHNGRIWKATSATELLPIFQAFMTTLLYRYVVTYRVFEPPHGPLRLAPSELNFDMLTMIDGSPVMNKIFFETGQSVISEKYFIFSDRSQTASFDEANLTTVLERYRNILNIVGRNLQQNTTDRIRIIGCRSDAGVEKDNPELARQRGQTVQAYLRDIWGIDPLRLHVEARDLPEEVTPAGVLGGRLENQRVEILYDSILMQAAAADDFILESSHVQALRIRPEIVAEYGIANWELQIVADDQVLKTLNGTDALKPVYAFALEELGQDKLVTFGNLRARIRVTDVHGDMHAAATEPCPIKVAKTQLIHELAGPPQGGLALHPDTVTIEELTTIDSSPLLNYVFFETGQSDIPPRYVLFSKQADTQFFDESRLKGTLEKYQQVLNIIGRRLVRHPEARIKLVGCNSNQGIELGKTDLSRSRAEAVRAYLKYIWGIAPERMETEARNLPAVASSGTVEAGRQENQRVEIQSDFPGLLDTIKSTYVEAICDTPEIRILPQIRTGYDLVHWRLVLTGDDDRLTQLEGQGALRPVYAFNIKDIGLQKLGAYRNLAAGLEVEDQKGQTHRATANTSVRFIQREERMARQMGYKVQEKYALILFDFDRAEIKARNQAVMDRIVARIKAVPSARVTIVGQTDTIGKEEYNLDLSKRRAKAAYDQILAGGVAAGDGLTYAGAGPFNPLYDNNLPEGRALNRTVTVALEYEAQEQKIHPRPIRK
ncbi:MAG: OmpA family protein [Desulfobacterales bacterium]|nr:MAG: OmpA family protein [Desulfobacterales bacterium]